MDPRAVDAVLTEAVARGAVPNAVVVAADRDGPVLESAAGPRVAGTDEPVTAGTHFRIMSMTKMVATVVALQQVERGALDLDAPVAEYCPEWAQLQVLDGFDGDVPRLRPPAATATVRHLLTHTSGLGYWFFNADLLRWETVTGTPNVLSGSNVVFGAPLLADPGTRLEYGINTDWLGKVVEAAGGLALDVAVKEGVTGPLGMDDTSFSPGAEQRANCVPVHMRGPDGAWQPSELDLHPEPEYFAGGHGLYSTPRDYLRFQRALLGNGAVDGVRILKAETVDAAFRNQIGDLDFPATIASADPGSTADFSAGPGHKWGYGLLLNTADLPGRRRAGSGAWAGLCNTHFWVDRTTGITAAVYTQTLPFVAPDVHQVYLDVETAIYGAL
ncbi:serine hydrolase domain-containing protein [Blastococcus xanthinilyticus]|uniref:CubicO group peptidase (Beta-lactamase class C family) n=1 Tax=Blastococcus xanthinilyticus TaxID=1564164 RepID=A0A5S5D130_9ACTN|nr:serine hydrolase domain-containing protein [Blastococcus xanthinilyticus]TYP88958.1 CubicO group peptidase (beta-lactamase class C family) [Blastococcus xanthinilyticus]